MIPHKKGTCSLLYALSCRTYYNYKPHVFLPNKWRKQYETQKTCKMLLKMLRPIDDNLWNVTDTQSTDYRHDFCKRSTVMIKTSQQQLGVYASFNLDNFDQEWCVLVSPIRHWNALFGGWRFWTEFGQQANHLLTRCVLLRNFPHCTEGTNENNSSR